jgi:hypothetical protein
MQIKELEGVFTCGAILGLHQYSRGRLDSTSDAPWYILRHRKLFERLRQWTWPVPQTIITECGYDFQGTGYKAHNVEWPEYFRQLVWWDQELRNDPQILAACIFNSGGTPDWASFEVGEAESRDLAAYIRAATSEPVIVLEPVKPTLAEVLAELDSVKRRMEEVLTQVEGAQQALSLAEHYQAAAGEALGEAIGMLGRMG